MKIKEYTVEELPDLLALEFYKDSDHIPIYPLRAISYFHNPSADKTDKVLWCLFEGEEMIAYRLVLPDTIKTATEKIKVCWLSCIWVNPKHRGKGLGKQLTNLALEEWDHKCLATNFAPASFKMYSSMQLFYPLKIVEGIRLYFIFNAAELLGKKNKLFATIKPLIKIGDTILNVLKPTTKEYEFQPNHLNAKIVLSMDEEMYNFICHFNQKEFGARSKASLDWILSHPWMKETQTKDDYAKRYHFSANAKKFEQRWHKIYIKEKLAAVMMTTIIDEKLKTPYLYLSKENVELIAKYLENYCLKNNLHSLTIFYPDIVAYLNSNNTKSIYKKSTKKKIMAWNGIPKTLTNEQTSFQDGLGDGVFT